MSKEKEKSKQNRVETASILEATLEAIKDGILVIDLEGMVTKANKNFLSMWRIPQELFDTGDDSKLLDYVLDQLKEPDVFINKVHQLYANPTEESFDILQFKDGRVFERSSKPYFLDDEVVGRVWSFYDVTIRHHAEEKLKLFEKAIIGVSDGVFVVNLNFDMVYINPAALALYGYSEEEMKGKNLRMFWSEKNTKTTFRDLVRETLKGNWKGELYSKTKDGKDVPIVLSTSFLKDENGKQIALIGVLKDITARRRMETLNNALYRISESVHSTSNLEELFERIHSIVKDMMLANNFYIALYDDSSNMISFPYFVDEFDPPQPPKKFGRGCTEYVLGTGSPVIIDKELSDELNRTGEVDIIGSPSEVWLGVPLKIARKTIGVMVVQDYHDEYAYGENDKEALMFVSEQVASAIERKRNEEELKRYTYELQKSNDLLEVRANELRELNDQLVDSEQRLIELNQKKDKFFSIVSHDLKSPFNSLLGFSSQLYDGMDDFSDEEKKKYIGYINDSSKHLFNLVQNLLSWALIQRGKEKYEPQNYNLKEFSEQIISILRGNAVKKNISLRNEINPDHIIYADDDMLTSILQNLISNAIKFTNLGGKIDVTSILKDEMVHVSIKDNGVGMDQHALQKIFQIESKHSTAGTADEHGTGFGLILVKELVEKNRGNIWVESEVGVGTTFTFTLPKSAA